MSRPIDGDQQSFVRERMVSSDQDLRGIWLSEGPVKTPIDALLLEMLEPNLPNPELRQSVIEELGHRVKLTSVVLDYLGLTAAGFDSEGATPTVLVAPKPGRHIWRDVLLRRGGEYPIGFIVNTRDRGRVALVHEVFAQFLPAHKDLLRQYIALAATGDTHEQVVEALNAGPEATRFAGVAADARRYVQFLDPSVLFSPNAEIRVQLGSLSQTARNLMREGLQAEHVFILPRSLFEGRTNYGDIEFLVYLNFFVRRGLPTRILGTAQQCAMLKRLLTLVIFGVFDPEAPELPSPDELRDAFGVPDRRTCDFFRTVYELYAVRKGPGPSSPIVRLDDYVEFIALEPHGTVVPVYRMSRGGQRELLGELRVMPDPSGSFEVSIAEPDGRTSAKRMETMAPRRMEANIPEALVEPIRFAVDRPRFGVTPLGTSHGFDPDGDVTSFIIWINGRGILVDPSPEALVYLKQIGVAPVDVPYVFLTHVHADHDGGLLEKLLGGSRTTLIASDPVFRAFAEKARIVTGHDFEREGLVKHLPANPGRAVRIDVGREQATLRSRWNLHPIPTNGFAVSFGGHTFGYSGDTQHDPDLIDRLRDEKRLTAVQYNNLKYFFWTRDGRSKVDLLYHEAGIPPIHTDKERLRSLPDAVKARTALVHVADREVPAGFVPAKPRLFATHVLMPATDASRDNILLDTVRMVPYLYDVPSEDLEALMHDAEIRDYATDDFIIRQGPVRRGQSLYFYVIADGEVLVKNGKRLITKLLKAETFGEWAISHQRGSQVADVAAGRPCKCIRFAESQYWALVDRHPAIQERITKIRSLLPRLQNAQQKLALTASADPLGRPRVLENMSAGQLSGVAIFSDVKFFDRGEHVVVEGAEPDGFYILLSGHLAATSGGALVGELSEGDVFGEIGLLEGERRRATVTAVSADAEVLFMSPRNFHRMLTELPAFAWGVRETARRRKETGARHHRSQS